MDKQLNDRSPLWKISGSKMDYAVCCCTDEKTVKKYLKFKKDKRTTDLIIYYKIIGLTAEMGLTSRNDTSHSKNRSNVKLLLTLILESWNAKRDSIYENDLQGSCWYNKAVLSKRSGPDMDTHMGRMKDCLGSFPRRDGDHKKSYVRFMGTLHSKCSTY